MTEAQAIQAAGRPQHPRLPQVGDEAKTRYGRAILRSVDLTSDGFVTGWADFYDDDGEQVGGHSVFLGQAGGR